MKGGIVRYASTARHAAAGQSTNDTQPDHCYLNDLPTPTQASVRINARSQTDESVANEAMHKETLPYELKK